MVTEREILELKRNASELRDKVIQAKATMTEVESSINSYEKELKSLGVKDIDNLDNEIAKMKNDIQSVYDEALSKIQKYL
ncbi:MAG: hypothetical protein ACRCX2_09925 [Paraclostridium sp.]